MKNTFKYLVIAGSAALITSCSGFLDSAPITSLVDENFYKTEADASKAIIACYDGLQIVWSDGTAWPVAADVMSDDCFGGTGNGDGFGYQLLDEFDLSRSPSDQDIYNQNWILYFKALYRCNMLLSKMDQISWSSTASRNRIEAEARFIRADLLFDMVKLWGHIPLVTEPILDGNYNLPQADPKDVYKVITEDLLFACDNAYLSGGEKWTKAWGAANDGRVTVYAAKSMLARVYLYYTGYYEKDDATTNTELGINKTMVIDQLEDVLTANSGHALVDSFPRLWPAACSYPSSADTVIGLSTTYAGEGNCETVFAIKFNSTGNWTGNTDGYIGQKMLTMRSGCFTAGNGKIYGAEGWGGATVTKNCWDSFDAADPRRKASIINVSGEGLSYSATDQREYTGYFNKKYTSLANPQTGKGFLAAQSLDFQINPYQDYIVIRYADVLLMLSELKADKTYMNEVRARVGLAPVATYTVEALRNERRFELAFEGIRYWDLLRYGQDYAAGKLATTLTVNNGGVNETKTISADKFRATKGLSQIPQSQIDMSGGVLQQNDGWR